MNAYDEMERALELLEAATDKLPSAAERAAYAERDWRVAEAKQRTDFRAHNVEKGRKVTVSEVDDWATLSCKDELLERELANALLAVARDTVRVYMTRIEALRSLIASQRVGI